MDLPDLRPSESRWEDYLPLCYQAARWALRKRNWYNMDDTQDVANETLTELWRYLTHHEVRTSDKALIYKIADRVAARFIKHNMGPTGPSIEYVEKIQSCPYIPKQSPNELPPAWDRLLTLVRSRLTPGRLRHSG